MLSSEGVRMPLVRGMERTLRTEGAGGEERSQGVGMRDCLAFCLRCEICCQVEGRGEVMVDGLEV